MCLGCGQNDPDLLLTSSRNMSETPSRGGGSDSAPPVGDPWAAFGYLVAGVLFYGLLGWVLSLWLHASYWIPIGILVGAGFGMFMVFSKYRFDGNDAKITDTADLPPTDTHTNIARTDTTGQPHDVGRLNRPASDDPGETL
jgi:ATP synthase protein I